ncbi:MAG: phosphatase PAP2 family protein [Desulfuromonadales bacterium]
MEAFLQDIFRWLPSGWIYYLTIGLISFFESLVVAGIFMPGSVLIVFAGFLAAHGKGMFLPLYAAAACGAICGDALSYWLGARMGGQLMRRPIFRKRVNVLHKAEIFFDEHGGKSVLIGRFVGFLRPFIPFIAGSVRMRPAPFVFYIIIGALLWGAVYPGLGYLFGASWKLVRVWTGRFSLLVGLLVALFILNALLWRWMAPLLFRLCARMWRRVLGGWQTLLATEAIRRFSVRHTRLWIFLGNRFRLGHGSGLSLTLGFFFSAIFALFFLWLSVSLKISDTLIRVDERIYEVAPLLHHSSTDTFFLLMTYLGDWPVLLALGGGFCVWLLLCNHAFSALILAAGTAGGQFLVFILKSVYSRPRPDPFFSALEPQSWAFPSAHAFEAAVFYGLMVYMVLGAVSSWRVRLTLITGCSFLALLIGFSRIYLGVHWFSDVLGGFLLAALWLAFLITACEMGRSTRGDSLWLKGRKLISLSRRYRPVLLTFSVILALGSTGAYISQQLKQDLSSRVPPTPPGLLMEQSPKYLRTELPTHTENLAGDRLRPLSLIVFAGEDQLANVLEDAGWQQARQRSLSSFWRRFINLEGGESQLVEPVVPLLVAGQDPVKSYVRPDPENSLPARLTAQIWDLKHLLPDGRSAWGLLASRCTDVQSFLSVDLPLSVHDPAVDRQRDALARQLARFGRVERDERIAGESKKAVDSLGNPFHTDGGIVLLWLLSEE